MSMKAYLAVVAVAVSCSFTAVDGFVSPSTTAAPGRLGGVSGRASLRGWPAARSLGAKSFAAGECGMLTKPWYQQCLQGQSGRSSSSLTMTASDNKSARGLSNAAALGVAAACAAGASAIAEISPHAAAFVQLVCLSIWLGMSIYATFLWPVITGINLRDSADFATLLGKLGPSYLQLSAAMIMSLATSSIIIGHANEVQLVILGAALAITLYNVVILEPSAVDVLEEEQAAERKRGKKTLKGDKESSKMQAQVANFVGAEVLLDLLTILCALAYAWDLASSITFA